MGRRGTSRLISRARPQTQQPKPRGPKLHQPKPRGPRLRWSRPRRTHPRRTDRRMRLSGKVALVTGAQQGIGRAIAIALARDGADVGVNFLDDSAAAEGVAGAVRGLGRRAVTVQGDVSKAASVEAMVKAVSAALGPPEVLVNNAGVFPRASFLELPELEWDHVLGVNLKGSFLCAQAVARALVAANRPGAIVNISSS